MVDMDDVWAGGNVVCVDFDGTLTQGKSRYWEGEVEDPRDEIIELVRELYYDGSIIIIWTARPWSQACTIAARMTEWDVPYHGLRCYKGGSGLYIDDKSVRPEELLDE